MLGAARDRARHAAAPPCAWCRSPSCRTRCATTRALVVTSHVSWATGRVMDDASRSPPRDALVLLDGAQGLGAVPVDVRALGCDFYAASGQKWLCGPDGIGYLYAQPGARAAGCPRPGAATTRMEWSEQALVPALQPDARRLATGLPGAAPRGLGARVARRARGGRLRRRARARPSSGAERLAGMLARPRRRRGRRGGHHARLLGGAGPRGRLSAGCAARAS